MKLTKPFRKLAKKAGFCFWEDESYGPGKGHIDWGTEYNEELQNFAQLIIGDCLKEIPERLYPMPSDDWERGYNCAVREIVGDLKDKYLPGEFK